MCFHKKPLLLYCIENQLYVCPIMVKTPTQNRNNSREIFSVRNDEYFNMYKTVWFKEDLILADIETNNVSEDELNIILQYTMVRLDS